MSPRTCAAASLAALLLAGCGEQPAPQAAAPAPGGSAPAAARAASAPPVSVTVVRAVKRDVALQVEANGSVAALSSVDVKPQVASVVTGVHVKEGQFVHKGQLLFTLDVRGDVANLAKAEAELLRSQALLFDAQRQLTRSQELLEQNFISKGAVDTARASFEAQRAAVAASRAAIEAARVAVSHGRIVAPSSGRVGQIVVFPGSSVSPTSTPLVTITQLDPIAVSFQLPQRHLPEALQALTAARAAPLTIGAPGSAASGAAGPSTSATTPGFVVAELPDGRGKRSGRLDFVDNAVDAASGTVRVKALFANKDQALWPGAYVNVQLALQALPGAVVIPQAAIVQGARGTSVIVAENGVAALRPVQVLQPLGTEAAVNGVRPGEKVVVDGRQNVRPGARLVERSAERPERPGGGRGAAASGPRGQGPGGASGPGGSGAGAGPGNAGRDATGAAAPPRP